MKREKLPPDPDRPIVLPPGVDFRQPSKREKLIQRAELEFVAELERSSRIRMIYY